MVRIPALGRFVSQHTLKGIDGFFSEPGNGCDVDVGVQGERIWLVLADERLSPGMGFGCFRWNVRLGQLATFGNLVCELLEYVPPFVITLDGEQEQAAPIAGVLPLISHLHLLA